MALDKSSLQSSLETAFGKDDVADATAKANIVIIRRGYLDKRSLRFVSADI